MRRVGAVPDDYVGAIDRLVVDEVADVGLIGRASCHDPAVDLGAPVADEPQVALREGPVGGGCCHAVVGAGNDLVGLARVAVLNAPPALARWIAWPLLLERDRVPLRPAEQRRGAAFPPGAAPR